MTFSEKVNGLFTDLIQYYKNKKCTYRAFSQYEFNEDWVSKYAYVRQQNWQGMMENSLAKLDLVNTKLLQIEKEQLAVSDFLERTVNLSYGVNSLKNPNYKAAYLKTMNEAYEKAAVSKDKRKLLLTAFWKSLNSPRQFERYVQKQFSGLIDLLDSQFESNMKRYMYNLYAKYASQIALGEGAVDSGNANTAYYYYIERFETEFLEFKGFILKRNIKGGINHLVNYNEWLLERIEKKFIPLMNYLNGKKESVSVNKRRLRISYLIQRALSDFAINKWLIWRLQWHDNSGLKIPVVQKIKRLAYTEIEMEGLKRNATSLLEEVEEYDMKNVVSEGVVSDMRTLFLGPTKRVTVAKLSDDNGNEVGIVVPFYQFDSIGVVEGTYCKVSGTFFAQHGENENMPAIVPKRLSLTALSKTNLYAWLRLKTNKLFELVPHNFNVQFGFKNGEEGLANPLKHDVIAKDLKMYNPKQHMPHLLD